MKAPVRVLIVDDSALVRRTLTEKLGAHPEIEVIGAAPDPYYARDIIEKNKPDALVLDIEMPRMDGLTFLQRIMAYAPIPTVIVSSLTRKGCDLAMACLEAGAIQVFCKPNASYAIGDLSRDLAQAIVGSRGLQLARKKPRPASKSYAATALPETTDRIVAIGTSTGGTDALSQILTALPERTPGMLIVQHMPAAFTKRFAERLNQSSALQIKEAEDGDQVQTGVALIAPGDAHMQLRRDGARYVVRIVDGPRVCGHKPSVEALFRSVAKYAGPNAMGAILTGMGSDGANGLLEMRRAGAYTIAQDEDSCVVYGMPREAAQLDAADQIVPLDDVASHIVTFAQGKTQKRAG